MICTTAARRALFKEIKIAKEYMLPAPSYFSGTTAPNAPSSANCFNTSIGIAAFSSFLWFIVLKEQKDFCLLHWVIHFFQKLYGWRDDHLKSFSLIATELERKWNYLAEVCLAKKHIHAERVDLIRILNVPKIMHLS